MQVAAGNVNFHMPRDVPVSPSYLRARQEGSPDTSNMVLLGSAQDQAKMLAFHLKKQKMLEGVRAITLVHTADDD